MIDLLIHYKYTAFFIGMILGGDLVLITAVYLAIKNQMDIGYVIVLAYISTTISDFIWYYIGKRLPTHKFEKYNFVQKRREFIDQISTFFSKHSFKTLFYSKFIYGTRTVVQMLGGAKGLKVTKYLAVNSLGTIGYIAVIVALGYTFKLGIEDLERIIHSAQILFLLFIATIFFINLWLQKTLKKHLFQ
jgi:membrane protein DedA with SNARE-associated domain